MMHCSMPFSRNNCRSSACSCSTMQPKPSHLILLCERPASWDGRQPQVPRLLPDAASHRALLACLCCSCCRCCCHCTAASACKAACNRRQRPEHPARTQGNPTASPAQGQGRPCRCQATLAAKAGQVQLIQVCALLRTHVIPAGPSATLLRTQPHVTPCRPRCC